VTASRVREIVLSAPAARTITLESRASRDDTETGGILLGSVQGHTAHVHHAGRPGPCAVRQPTFFSRDLEHAQRVADQAFITDQSVWIGEWHTHLNLPPVPSECDLATYYRLLADPELAFDHFIAIIASTPNNWLTVSIGRVARPPQGHSDHPNPARSPGF